MAKVTDQMILKAILLLRKCGNKYQSKEEQIAEQKKWLAEIPGYADEFEGWIQALKEDLAKTPEQREAEFEEFLEREAEYDYQEQRMYAEHERDEWDDLWDDRARSVGARW